MVVVQMYTDSVQTLISTLKHFVSKNGLNINISDNEIELLVNHKIVSNRPDLLNIEAIKEQICNTDQLGMEFYTRLSSEIEHSKSIKASNFLYSLGIEGLSKKDADYIAKKMNNNVMRMVRLGHKQLMALGLTEKKATSYEAYVTNLMNYKEVKLLLKQVVITDSLQGIFNGETFTIKAEYLEQFMSKKELVEYIESNGGIIVNRKTADYIIVDQKNMNVSPCSLLLTENEFVDLCVDKMRNNKNAITV